MSRQTAAIVTSALVGIACAVLATGLGASIQVALPIFVGCLSGGMTVAFMKKGWWHGPKMRTWSLESHLAGGPQQGVQAVRHRTV